MSDNAITTEVADYQVAASRAAAAESLATNLLHLPMIAGALAKAQSAVRAVKNDATNDYHKYPYTSSEAIIEAGKDALANNGLALLPLEETLDGWQREGPERFELHCKFLLIHTSGEVAPLIRHWPVVPDRGRPLDKATAAAATLALAYLLRDLLLMPRVAPQDDVNARDDRPQQQEQRRSSQKPSKPAKAPPANGAELLERLKVRETQLVKDGLCEAGELLRHIAISGTNAKLPSEISAWGAEGIRLATSLARGFIEIAQARKANAPKPAAPATQPAGFQGGPEPEGDQSPDPAQVIGKPEIKELERLVAGAKLTWQWCRNLLGMPREALPADLTFGPYGLLVRALQDRQPKKAS